MTCVHVLTCVCSRVLTCGSQRGAFLFLCCSRFIFHLFKEWQSSNWHMQRNWPKERNGSVGDRSLSKAPYSSVLRYLSVDNQTQNILAQLDCLASKFLERVCLCLPSTEVVNLYPLPSWSKLRPSRLHGKHFIDWIIPQPCGQRLRISYSQSVWFVGTYSSCHSFLSLPCHLHLVMRD